MPRFARTTVILLSICCLSAYAQDASLLKGMQWREVGPYRGGRADAVEGVPGQPNTYYFGATGGGVWKTTDGGQTWTPVSDGFFGGTIGAIAVAPSDPLNYPIRLNDKLAGVGDSASAGSFAPTAQQIAVRDELVAQIDAQLATLKAIWDKDLPELNKLVKDLPAVK